jgi:hypothetical protein
VGEPEDPRDVMRVNEVFQGYATGHGTSLAALPDKLSTRVINSVRIGKVVFDELLAHLADIVAAEVIDRLARQEAAADNWLDTRGASEYLGIHRYSLRRLAVERAMPAEQAGAGCKLFFRRSDLDAWRRRDSATVVAIRSGAGIMADSSPAPPPVRVERAIYRRSTGVLEVCFNDEGGRLRWRTVDGGILAARKL